MDYKYKDLFLQDSIKKELYISFDNGLITNSELHSNQFELSESICSDSELRFGGCEASELRFKVSNIYNSLKNKTIDVSMVLDGNEDEPFKFGRYTVYSDTPTADRNFRDIVAYDKMYDIVNANVADWYNSLQFPMTLKEFRTAFVSYFGINEVEIELVNDDMNIEKTIETIELSGGDVARAICEINGCFGHINRNNEFEYIVLLGNSELFPANDLYPANELFPFGSNYSKTVSKSHYISCQYEDFITKEIDGIEVIPEEESAGAIVGNAKGNVYTIFGNLLLYGKTTEQLENIAYNLMPLVNNVYYRPCNIVAIGDPTIRVGDGIRLNTKHEVINTYVLQRRISGIQSLKDSYISYGTERYEHNINSSKNDVVKLKSKVNILTRTVDETKSYIADLDKDVHSEIAQNADNITSEVSRAKNAEEALSSRVTQNANGITSKVSKGSVSSEISQEADTVSIKGNRLIVESENFTLDKDGKVFIGGWLQAEDGIRLMAPYINSETDGTHTPYDVFGYLIDIKDLSQGRFGVSTIIYGPYGNDSIVIGKDGFGSYSVNIPSEVVLSCSGGIRASSLSVSGTKSRIATTKNYGERLLYCYETPSPMFGDIGEGQLDETGKCYVSIDDMFGETVDLDCKYQVFLQAYGKGECYVAERTPYYFVVEGTENLSFGWEIKAIQKEYDTMRLEQYGTENFTESSQETLTYLNHVVESSNEKVVSETYNYLTESLYSPESEVI